MKCVYRYCRAAILTPLVLAAASGWAWADEYSVQVTIDGTTASPGSGTNPVVGMTETIGTLITNGTCTTCTLTDGSLEVELTEADPWPLAPTVTLSQSGSDPLLTGEINFPSTWVFTPATMTLTGFLEFGGLYGALDEWLQFGNVAYPSLPGNFGGA